VARIADGPASEERRRQILAAAMGVFACKGYTGATNKDIAREAGVTSGLIYHYFADKRALFEAVVAEFNPLAGSVTGILSAGDADDIAPAVLLRRLVITMIERLEGVEYLPTFRLMMGEALRDPEIADVLNASSRRVVTALADYLGRQQARGALRPLDPYLVAQFLFGSLTTCVMRRALGNDPTLMTYTGERIAATLVEMALGGLSPAPPPVTLE